MEVHWGVNIVNISSRLVELKWRCKANIVNSVNIVKTMWKKMNKIKMAVHMDMKCGWWKFIYSSVIVLIRLLSSAEMNQVSNKAVLLCNQYSQGGDAFGSKRLHPQPSFLSFFIRNNNIQILTELSWIQNGVDFLFSMDENNN